MFWTTLILPAFLLGVVGAAQPTFSSAYTDLNVDCKPQSPLSDPNGGDGALLCKGYGGYQVRVYFSAWATFIRLERDRTVPISLMDASGAELDYAEQRGRKLEWRLIAGKPFAVILRLNTYRTDLKNRGDPFQNKYKTGTVLKVIGLAGFETLQGRIDAAAPNANARARAFADRAYWQSGGNRE